MSQIEAQFEDAHRAAAASVRSTVETVVDCSEIVGQPGFLTALRMLAAIDGHVVVTGLGKSGYVGKRLAATLSSVGTPAFFVHASEALHGDAGSVTSRDALIAISNSGTTTEVCRFAEIVQGLGVPVLAITGNRDSALAEMADVSVEAGAKHEADPHDLVPSASLAAVSTVGDALAIALMVYKGFTPSDFRRTHPHGSLGHR